jgi:hypothetical protein
MLTEEPQVQLYLRQSQHRELYQLYWLQLKLLEQFQQEIRNPFQQQVFDYLFHLITMIPVCPTLSVLGFTKVTFPVKVKTKF